MFISNLSGDRQDLEQSLNLSASTFVCNIYKAMCLLNLLLNFHQKKMQVRAGKIFSKVLSIS